jgi:hypothetical protein
MTDPKIPDPADDDLEPPDDLDEDAYAPYPLPSALWCDCRPGAELYYGWQHAPDCGRWEPPRRGPGSTDEARAAAMAHIRAVLADTKRRHQEADKGRRASLLPSRRP